MLKRDILLSTNVHVMLLLHLLQTLMRMSDDFHKLLATMIGTAGVNLVAKMDDPCGTGSSSDNGSMLRAFLSIALVLMAHPSIEISTEVLSAWSQLLSARPEVLQSHHVVVLASHCSEY